MIALVDTNVVLDVLLAREPHVKNSAEVFAAVEVSRCRGLLCATTVTTLHYIARKTIGTKESLARIGELMAIFEIAAVNRAVLESAASLGMPDFEDAVMREAALLAGADCIVTRNVGDFRLSKILVYTPAQFVEALAGEEKA